MPGNAVLALSGFQEGHAAGHAGVEDQFPAAFLALGPGSARGLGHDVSGGEAVATRPISALPSAIHWAGPAGVMVIWNSSALALMYCPDYIIL